MRHASGTFPTLLGVGALALPVMAVAQTPVPAADAAAALERLEWRPIGPANMGGRVTAILGVPGDPRVFWVAGADGGVFKTENAGITFEPQFDDQRVYSVGALALAPSDHNVVWLGSGEGDPRNSTSYGDGVYRSTDGGETWTHLGLDDSERIKRIAVHPGDPDVAWVCALGHAWGPNEERGVFRTTDAGRTWEKVLYRDEDTGCSDLAIDPSNPRILYAGMWTFRRRPWRFDDGGGETAVYRTKDGGDTWEKLTEGLPDGPLARIGIAVSRSDRRVVYVVSEAKEGGILWRSDDGGDSFRLVHSDARINFRPFYYSDIRVDPVNPDVVYSLSGGLYKSIDGGRTFDRIGGSVHGDHQAFWIDPEDARRLLSGSDGGFQLSYDAGENWDVINNVELSQFYQVAYDFEQPYRVCGGLQDNGGWCGPHRTRHGEILKDDWFRVSGGDGFYTIPVPDQPDLIYSDLQGGVFMLTDMRSGATRRIHPYPNKIGSSGDAMLGHRYRFNWDAPIHISPHDPATVYIGGNHVFRSRDQGHSWEELSPDLTTRDTTKQLTSGGDIYQDNTAAEFHTTIVTIAESPVRAGIIWAGTDDGNIQVTRDGGATWTNVSPNVPGLPAETWIGKIDASHHDACTAYVAVDNHRLDDFAPYAWRTTDCGGTWTDLAAGLPQDDYVKVVREDTRNPNLLYAGMERGIQASWDAGRTWMSLRANLPPVSVRDIQIHPRDNDLIIGTHGRGAWILDDIGALQELPRAAGAPAWLVASRPAIRWEGGGRDASPGERTYQAPNPEYGAFIDYFLAEPAADSAAIRITDARGQTIRDLRGPADAGLNRVVWDLEHEGPARLEGGGGGGGGGGGFGGGGGPLAVPGTYGVTVSVGGRELSGDIEVLADPAVDATPADYDAQLAAALELRDLISRTVRLISDTRSLDEQLGGIETAVKANPTSVDDEDAVSEALDAADDELAEFEDRLTYPIPGLGYRQVPRLREELSSLFGSVTGPPSPPTEGEVERLGELREETATAEADFQAILATTIADLNRVLGGTARILLERRELVP